MAAPGGGAWGGGGKCPLVKADMPPQLPPSFQNGMFVLLLGLFFYDLRLFFFFYLRRNVITVTTFKIRYQHFLQYQFL